jgi:hypothetical protein
MLVPLAASNDVLEVSVVNPPVFGVVDPMVPGMAHVPPSNWDTFRLPTTVVDVTTNGAVPIATVDVNAGAWMLLDETTALVDVPATAGAVKVADPDEDPVSDKIPLLVPASPTVNVGAENVNWVLVSGAAAAPPPSTSPPDASSAEVAHVLAEEKYGIPPLVPATVNAGVVVGVATDIRPPVNPTEVTVPVPAGRSAATNARKVGAEAAPVVGPAHTKLAV